MITFEQYCGISMPGCVYDCIGAKWLSKAVLKFGSAAARIEWVDAIVVKDPTMQRTAFTTKDYLA